MYYTTNALRDRHQHNANFRRLVRAHQFVQSIKLYNVLSLWKIFFAQLLLAQRKHTSTRLPNVQVEVIVSRVYRYDEFNYVVLQSEKCITLYSTCSGETSPYLFFKGTHQT